MLNNITYVYDAVGIGSEEPKKELEKEVLKFTEKNKVRGLEEMQDKQKS